VGSADSVGEYLCIHRALTHDTLLRRSVMNGSPPNVCGERMLVARFARPLLSRPCVKLWQAVSTRTTPSTSLELCFRARVLENYKYANCICVVNRRRRSIVTANALFFLSLSSSSFFHFPTFASALFFSLEASAIDLKLQHTLEKGLSSLCNISVEVWHRVTKWDLF